MPGMGTNALGGASTTGGGNNAPALAQPTGAYFDSLLEKNKKRAQGETVAGELPSLQLGLGDLRQKLRKLGPSGGTGAGRVVDGKAHYLLAASGVDPGLAVKDLGSFGLQARAERLATLGAAGAAEVDVDTYLNNLQKKTTLSMIADGLDRSVRDFDNFLEDNVTMEWDAQRKRIYEHFGIKPREAEVGAGRALGGTPARDSQGGFGRSKRKPSSQAPNDRPSQRASLLGRSGLMRSVIGPPSQIGSHASEFTDVEPRKDAAGGLKGAASSLDDRLLREKQGRLADKIRDLNNARLQGQPICIFHELADIETKSGDRHQLVKAYQGMMEVVGENPDQEEAPRGRQFARYYLDPNPQSQNALMMRHKILLGAQRFLEKKFFSELEALIAKHPIDANLGGRPDVVSKIKAFVRLKLAHKTLAKDNTTGLQLANGEYLWAIVYFLLRAGFVAEAAQYVNTNESLFRSMDRAFLGYINSYASSEDRRLKRQMQDRCANEYNQRVRNSPEGSVDPYRMACYKIIGRCDLSNRSLDDTLMPDVYDWYWLQFALARESDKTLELAGESFGLLELQASVKEIGLKHFPKSPSDEKEQKLDFGMAFYLQLLAGMYEQAVAYLYQFSYVDAVHFAIALSYYGLLRPADVQGSNELLSHNTRGVPQINFGQMLGYYTRDFRAANSAAAVDYLVLICLNADDSTGGQQQAQLCHEALRELVLETREYSRLIGDVRPDGRRIKGVVEERGPLIALGHESDFIRAITLRAASFADDSGRTTDAVLLYHLAGDYDSVVSIVSRALSEAISLEIGEDPIRLEPVVPRTSGQEAERGSSLSLAAIDDPVELAGTMMSMYERDHMFWQNIRDQNRLACKMLLKMSEIKGLVAEGRWPECLDVSLPPCFHVIQSSNEFRQTEDQRTEDTTACGGWRPQHDPTVRIELLGTRTAGGHQRAELNHVDHNLLHEAARAADEWAV